MSIANTYFFIVDGGLTVPWRAKRGNMGIVPCHCGATAQGPKRKGGGDSSEMVMAVGHNQRIAKLNGIHSGNMQNKGK